VPSELIDYSMTGGSGNPDAAISGVADGVRALGANLCVGRCPLLNFLRQAERVIFAVGADQHGLPVSIDVKSVA
jgi:glycine/D-amino acid oxidase-like deaminating enzyme